MSGLVVTCQVTAAALALALVLGFLIAVLKVLPCRPLRAVLNFYTSIFRGVPLIVLLFLAYFATPQLTGFKISMFAAGAITLGLNGSATVSETVRGGIEGVDRGQYDAARAIGLRYVPMMRKIIDFAAEGIAAMLMAVIVNAAAKDGQVKPGIAIVATFVTTFVSGVIFMVIKMAMLGVVGELAAAMLPVVAMTAVFNAILVGALYVPIQKALKLN